MAILVASTGLGTYAAGTKVLLWGFNRHAARAGLTALMMTAPLGMMWEISAPVVRSKIQKAVDERQALGDDATVPMSTWYSLGVIQNVISWASEDWALWATSYSLLVVSAMVSTLMPVVLMETLKVITTGGNVPNAVIFMTGVMMGSASLSALRGVVDQEVQTRLAVRIQKIAIANVLGQEMAFFDKTSTGTIFTQLGSVGSIRTLVSELLPGLVTTTVKMTTVCTVLSSYDSKLAFICTIGIPADYILTKWYSKFLTSYSMEVQEISAANKTVVLEMVQSAKTVKAFGAEDEQMSTFWNSVDQLIKLRTRNNVMLGGSSIINTAIPHFNSLLMFGYAGSLARAGLLDMNQLLVVANFQGQLSGLFSTLIDGYGQYATVLGTCAKGYHFMNRKPQQRPRGTLRPEGPLQGAIEFRDVTFKYESQNEPVLRGFNLKIRPGERVALVGPSGGGKSTCVNLILGVYDSEEGDVFIDGHPVSEYDPTWYYSRGVSVVNQNPVLFQASILDNIVMGLKDEADVEEAEEAAKKANAHDFVMQLPDGYETDVGRGGERLSGGQRQRVAIARAIVRNPSVLLLDEATSALDAESEHLVKEALERTMEGRTVVIVAHRLSTIQNVDRILVINEGQIAEEGTHTDLLQKGGIYTTLVRTQLINDIPLTEATTP